MFFRKVDFGGLGTQDARLKLTSEIGRVMLTYRREGKQPAKRQCRSGIPHRPIIRIGPWINIVFQVSKQTIDESYYMSTQAQGTNLYEVKLFQRIPF